MTNTISNLIESQESQTSKINELIGTLDLDFLFISILEPVTKADD